MRENVAMTSPTVVDENAWTARVHELCELAGQTPVPVEFADGTSGAARYLHRRDVLVLKRGWCANAGCPDGPAGSWMIAHELGHRAEREAMERSGKLILPGIALSAVVAAAVGLSFWWAGGSPLPATFAGTGIFLLLFVLVGRLLHPAEFRADDFAADLLNDPTATAAALSVTPRSKWSDRVGWDRPTRTQRIACQADRQGSRQP